MVQVNVDMDRREDLRRLHTSAHILNYSARQVLGNHVWQNGSNLKREYGTLDITHYDHLTFDEIKKIEQMANETVFENKKVSTQEIDRGEAEEKFGFVLYQGGAIPQKVLRVVSIIDSDIEACGGIHMQETGGIGLIKIVEVSKIQDGVIRLKFVVRNFALDFINSNKGMLDESSKVFSVENSQLPKTCLKFFNEWKTQKKEIDSMKKQLKEVYVNSILDSKLNEFEIKSEVDMGFVMEIFTSVFGRLGSFKLTSPKFVIATSDIEVGEFKKSIPKGKFTIYIM